MVVAEKQASCFVRLTKTVKLNLPFQYHVKDHLVPAPIYQDHCHISEQKLINCLSVQEFYHSAILPCFQYCQYNSVKCFSQQGFLDII